MSSISKALITVLALLFLAGCGGGDDDAESQGNTVDIAPVATAISELPFSDPLLKQCSAAAASSRGWTTAGEVTELDCSADDIRLLGGIQAFSNLGRLNISQNKIKDITLLGSLGNLQELDISGLPDLEKLDALLRLGKLETVTVTGSGSGGLECADLEALAARVNLISSPNACRILISDIVFADRALANCVSSTANSRDWIYADEFLTLDCDASGVAQLDGIEELTNLKSLSVNENTVSDLSPLAQLVSLETVLVADNPVTDISDLAGLGALRMLDLRGASGLGNLDPLLNLDNLQAVTLAEDTGGGNLSCESLDALNDRVETLNRPSGCNILITDVFFADPVLRQCVLERAADSQVLFTSELSNLVCQDEGITRLDGIENFFNMTALTLSGNEIRDLGPLASMSKLRGLILNDNSISDFYALGALSELRLIEASNNAELVDISTIIYMEFIKFLYLDGSGFEKKISCSDIDIVAERINDPAVQSDGLPGEFRPPEFCDTGVVIPDFVPPVDTDLNADGKSDIVLDFDAVSIQGTQGLNSWIFETADLLQFSNDNVNAPRQSADIFSFKNAVAIGVADANNDLKDDLLVQLDANDNRRHWQVFTSDGVSLQTNTLQSFSLEGGNDARAVAFTDINADGYADILIQRQVRSAIVYSTSMGSAAGYAPPTDIYEFNIELGRAEMVALQDINGDGTADMVFDRVTGNRHCFFARAYRNGAFEAQSSKSRCAYVERPSDWNVKGVGVADLTGNGRAELVVSFRNPTLGGSNGTYFWMSYTLVDGAGGSEWKNEKLLFSASDIDGPARTVSLRDLNNDGRSDLLIELTRGITKSWDAYFANDYGNFFRRTVLTGAGLTFETLGVREYNGDDFPDLLISAPKRNASGTGVVDELYVKTGNGQDFISSPWRVWYSDDENPRVVGLEDGGLTSDAHNRAALIGFAGNANDWLTENEFAAMLAAGGLTLINTENEQTAEVPLRSGQCKVGYSKTSYKSSRDSLKVEGKFAVLMCMQKLTDRLTLTTAVLYAECGGVSNRLGVATSCKLGIARESLKADFGGGVTEEIVFELPNAEVCAGINAENLCAAAGVEAASVSSKLSIKGAGSAQGKLAVGIGAGGKFAVKDGQVAVGVDLKFLLGGSIEISLDYQATGELFYHVGESTYLFVEEGATQVVLAAGPAVRDAVNTTGKVFEVGLNEGVFIAVEGSAVAAVVFEDIGRPVGDVVDGIESGLIGAVDAVGGGIISIGETVGGGIGSAVNVIGSIF